MKRNQIFRIILICFGTFVAFPLTEILLRAMEYYQYVKRSARVQYEQYKQIYRSELEEDYLFGHHPNAHVKLEKGFYDFTFITNSEGLREKKDYSSLEKSVIFLGDSIVEGASVENEEAMDEVFEAKTGITALNFGLGSANTAHEYYWLINKYKEEYHTKLIILGYCLNDFDQTYLRSFNPELGNWELYRYLDEDAKETKEINYLKRSRALVFFYSALRKITNTSVAPYSRDQVTEERKKYTQSYLRKTKDFSDKIGAEFLVVLFPQEQQLRIDYEDKERMQDALIEMLEKDGIKYIDLYDIMKKKCLEDSNVRCFHDDTHPAKAGHQLIGEYLSAEIPKIFPKIFQP